MTHPNDNPPQEPDLETQHLTEALLHSRITTLPKRLIAPGPDAGQQDAILAAAAAAPDHGQLQPWRFMEVPQDQRTRLADCFAAALRERDPQASDCELARAGEKAGRAPWLLLAVCRVRAGDPGIPATERLLSAGCAIQNMLLQATALGFGSALTSGQALQSQALRQLFRLGDDEDAICFLNFGSVAERRRHKPRPVADAYFSRLD